jgi:hypothetical protein
VMGEATEATREVGIARRRLLTLGLSQHQLALGRPRIAASSCCTRVRDSLRRPTPIGKKPPLGEKCRRSGYFSGNSTRQVERDR